MKRLIVALGLVALSFTLSQKVMAAEDWKQKWENTLAAAKKEGKVVVYGEVTPDARTLLGAAFMETFGIPIEWVAGKSAELATKYLAERSAGLKNADAFHMGIASSINLMKPKGAVVPLEPYLILPEVKDPTAYLYDRVPGLDKEMTLIALNFAYTSYVAVNTTLVKDGELKSYKDLLHPKWKGKVVLFDPLIPSAATGWATFMIGKAYGLEAGTKFLRDFVATEPMTIKDVRQQVEWVARGKYAIGVGVQHALVSDFKKAGAPLDMPRFAEGGNINPASGFIQLPPNPAHPSAAIIYLNWLLTDKGQAMYAQGFSSPSVRKGVQVKDLDPIKVAKPGEKAFLADEEWYRLQTKGLPLFKEIFQPLQQ